MEHIGQILKMTSESVSDTINRLGMITEMAVPLKKYKARVDGLRFQLVENWCLSKYCQLFDPGNPNFRHWINELKACIDNLKFLDIKNGDKGKTLEKMLLSDYDYNEPTMIRRIAAWKFKKEGITDGKRIDRVCREFALDIKDLIRVISDNDKIVDEYLQETFEP